MLLRGKALLALVVALLCAGFLAQTASAEVRMLREPSPLSDSLRQKILNAGPEGVQRAEEELNIWCPGVQERGVQAGGCIVDPYGCTANYIWTDGSRPYIGTARHCVDKVGDPVIMQVDTTTLAEVGTVVRHTSGDGEPGNDFALIQIYPEVAEKWGVVPRVPVIGGPQGIYDGCEQQQVQNYGHGYEVWVAQGKPQGGLAYVFYDDGYAWFGNGFGGDSGSPVNLADKRSAGNFTHMILVDLRGIYVPGSLAGMRTPEILDFLGPSYALVNEDGSTSFDDDTPCPPSNYADSGSGGGNGGGGKGGKDKGDGGKGGGNGKGKKQP